MCVRVCVGCVKSDILHPQAVAKNSLWHSAIIRNSSGPRLHNWVIELLAQPPSEVSAQHQVHPKDEGGIQIYQARCGWRRSKGVSGAKEMDGGDLTGSYSQGGFAGEENSKRGVTES